MGDEDIWRLRAMLTCALSTFKVREILSDATATAIFNDLEEAAKQRGYWIDPLKEKPPAAEPSTAGEGRATDA